MTEAERAELFGAMSRARWARVGKSRRRKLGQAAQAAQFARSTPEERSERAKRAAATRRSRVREKGVAEGEQEPAEKAGSE
jgi:hypothetical protein